MDEIRETVNSFGDGSLGGLISEIFGEEQEADSFENPEIADSSELLSDEDGELPEKIVWDTEDPLYYEEELQAGFYTAGYDFPAGTYQATCTSGNVMIEWYAADEEEEKTDTRCCFRMHGKKNLRWKRMKCMQSTDHARKNLHLKKMR